MIILLIYSLSEKITFELANQNLLRLNYLELSAETKFTSNTHLLSQDFRGEIP